VLVDQTPCYGSLWQDDNGTCPELECAIRKPCQEVFESVQVNERIEQLEERHPEAIVVNTKYKKAQYTPLNRPVDLIVSSFKAGLGNPEYLPIDWSYHQLRRGDFEGRLHLAATVNYHLVLIDGLIVCRLWTNAANCALVDLSQNMEKAVTKVGFSIIPISDKILKKIRPCTGRIYCYDSSSAENIAKLILSIYNVGIVERNDNEEASTSDLRPKE
jgi:hypothetical protein